MKPARLQRGMSLVELMTVLAIILIMLGAAVPSFSGMLRRQKLRTATDDLVAAISLARAQAISRGRRVLLIPADPAGVNWARGWIVLADRDANRRLDPGDELILSHGPLDSDILVSSQLSSHQQPDYLAYNGMGRSCTATSSLAARWGTLSLVQGDQTRRIKINMLGRVRICDPAREPATCGGDAQTQ